MGTRSGWGWKMHAAIVIYRLHNAWNYSVTWAEARQMAGVLQELERARPPSQRRSPKVAVFTEFDAMVERF